LNVETIERQLATALACHALDDLADTQLLQRGGAAVGRDGRRCIELELEAIDDDRAEAGDGADDAGAAQTVAATIDRRRLNASKPESIVSRIIIDSL